MFNVPNRTKMKEQITESDIFRQVSEQDIDQMLRSARSVLHSQGDIIFRMGDIPRSVYFVISGSIKIEVPLPTGEMFFIGICAKNTLFGEHEALCGKFSIAQAQTLTDAELIEVPKSHFIEVFNANRMLSQQLSIRLATNMRSYMLGSAYRFTNSPDKQLANLLVYLAKQVEHDKDTTSQYKLKLSQEEIAQMLSTSRQTVNKYLQLLRQQGWINVRGTEIELLKIAELKEHAGIITLDKMGEALKKR